MVKNAAEFIEHIRKGYECKGEAITLGAAMLNREPLAEAKVQIPTKTLNRHGLIAGATGTGKTKTLQLIVENMSLAGIPCLMMDVKGDLSGLAAAGEEKPFITDRHTKIGLPYSPQAFPVELLTISKEKGTRLRATVAEFGPVLMSKILDLNDTQGGVMALVFKYADDESLPILDLKDLKKVLNFIINEGKASIQQQYGSVSPATVSTIIRKIIELEQQGAERFFGERSFDVDDLVRFDDKGRGILSIMRITDIQDKPKLFSTFMLSLLAEIYANFPEQGDADKPKLCLFIDEAHLVFQEASKTLLTQIETIVKLIRSKGVGVYFVTQNPYDIPAGVLSQLGLKVQHALRAFTAKDRQNIKKTAENYPLSDFYKTENLLTELGIGEALVTGLNEKGIPTPLAAVYLRAPMSRMDILSENEIDSLVAKSKIARIYNEEIDSDSAHEILTRKIEGALEAAKPTPSKVDNPTTTRRSTKQEKSSLETIMSSSVGRQVGRTIASELTRGLLGILGIKQKTTRRR